MLRLRLGLFRASINSRHRSFHENHLRPFEMRTSNGLESHLTSDCRIESGCRLDALTSEGRVTPHAWLSKVRVLGVRHAMKDRYGATRV